MDIDPIHCWAGSLAVGPVLMIWLAIQTVLIGFHWPIQYVTDGTEILIVMFASIPGVRRLYALR